jgi:hypothetical protein
LVDDFARSNIEHIAVPQTKSAIEARRLKKGNSPLRFFFIGAQFITWRRKSRSRVWAAVSSGEGG